MTEKIALLAVVFVFALFSIVGWVAHCLQRSKEPFVCGTYGHDKGMASEDNPTHEFSVAQDHFGRRPWVCPLVRRARSCRLSQNRTPSVG